MARQSLPQRPGRRRRSRCVGLPALLAALVAAAWAAAAPAFWAAGLRGAFAPPAKGRLRTVAIRRRALPQGDPAALEALLKDPQQMEAVQAEMDKIFADPAKRKAMEAWQAQVQSNVEKLRQDPEMREYFEDLEKNGFAALKKYEGNERILRKLADASGLPATTLAGTPLSAAPAGAGAGWEPLEAPDGSAGDSGVPRFRPGDEVVVRGLRARPELNGRRALVLPPSAEERETVKGSGRLIVRLLDSGEQFAVKPDNLNVAHKDLAAVAEASPEAPAAAVAEAAAEGSEQLRAPEAPVEAEASTAAASELLQAATDAATSVLPTPPPALAASLQALAEDPELRPMLDDIQKNGMAALNRYWSDPELMAKLSKALGT